MPAAFRCWAQAPRGKPAHARCTDTPHRAERRGGTLPFPPGAVQVNVEIGGRTEALDEGHGAGVDLGPFLSGLLEQERGDDPMNDLQHWRK
jgi:hypothetical protein